MKVYIVNISFVEMREELREMRMVGQRYEKPGCRH